MSEISNYQGIVDLTSYFGTNLPKKIKAETPFEAEITLNVTNDSVAEFVLCISAEKTDVTGVATIVKVE